MHTAASSGEVAHHNLGVLARHYDGDADDLAAVLKLARPQESVFTDPRRGMNAHSLAACLDVAYETMRRKLSELVERGFLERDRRGLYWLRSHVPDAFQAFNEARRADLLATADAVEALRDQHQARVHGPRHS
jgi:hypothetical protein